jgi:hypothetical protein
MSSGYSASKADTITRDQLNKVCPKEYATFMKACDDSEEFNIDSYSNVLDMDDGEHPSIKIPYDELYVAFNLITGLELSLSAHDGESKGDVYDDVDGHFWCIDNAYVMTPDAIAFENEYGDIEDTRWVEFG